MTSPGSRTVFDFGMHRGEDTAFYLALGASVIGIEANPQLVALNRARFAAEIAAGQLVIVEGAVAAPGQIGPTVTFYVNDAVSVWGTITPAWADRNARSGFGARPITVPVLDLPALLARCPHALYAKIDLEGVDPVVVAAFAAAGAPPAYLSVESSITSYADVAAEIARLVAMGYTRFAAVEQAALPGREVTGRTLDGDRFAFRFERDASGGFGPYLTQPWRSAEQVLADYRAIFRLYRLVGNESFARRYRLTRLPLSLASRAARWATGTPLYRWYDTHAALPGSPPVG